MRMGSGADLCMGEVGCSVGWRILGSDKFSNKEIWKGLNTEAETTLKTIHFLFI